MAWDWVRPQPDSVSALRRRRRGGLRGARSRDLGGRARSRCRHRGRGRRSRRSRHSRGGWHGRRGCRRRALIALTACGQGNCQGSRGKDNNILIHVRSPSVCKIRKDYDTTRRRVCQSHDRAQILDNFCPRRWRRQGFIFSHNNQKVISRQPMQDVTDTLGVRRPKPLDYLEYAKACAAIACTD